MRKHVLASDLTGHITQTEQEIAHIKGQIIRLSLSLLVV
jgi:hypothetical protein